MKKVNHNNLQPLYKKMKKGIKVRFGVCKKGFAKEVQKAFDKGIKGADCVGSIYTFIQDKQHYHQAPLNSIRIYNRRVWVFIKYSLIAVYDLPCDYHKYADRLRA